MPKASPGQVSFNAGELSPRLEGRYDLAKYANGCRTLENFLPMVQGGLIKRSGTRHIMEVKDSASATRMIPFEYGTEQAYQLEFGDLYVRVKKDSGAVLETGLAINQVQNTSPITINHAAPHLFTTGQMVFISGSLASLINGSYFNINVTGANNYELVGTIAIGVFGAGGTSARAVEFATPYLAADVAALDYTQSADVLYLAHPDYPPQKISRTSHTEWTLDEIAFDAPPFAQENLEKDDYMVASAASGVVNLYSSGGHFLAGHVGGFVKLAETLEGTYPEWQPNTFFATAGTNWEKYRLESAAQNFGDASGGFPENSYAHYQGRLYRCMEQYGEQGTGPTPPLHETGTAVDGLSAWEFINPGYGWALITAFVDAYSVTATVVREFGRTNFHERAITAISNAAPNIVTTGASHDCEIGDKVFIYGSAKAALNNLVFEVETRPAANQVGLLGTAATGVFGAGGFLVKVRSGDQQGVPNTRRRRLHDGSRWAFGAFSDERGFPSSVAFFEDRLLWAGTESDPQGIWASRTGRYEDHMLTDEDDGALFLLLNTQKVNAIEWFSSGKRLAMGTAGGEFVLKPATEGAVTAGNAKADQHSSWRSRSAVKPLLVDSVTLFVQRSGKKLIEYEFDFESDNYQGVDLTVLSHHVTLPRIAELAWAQEPDRLVWAALEDGQLVAMTYDRAQEVVGWHRHPLGGTDAFVESVSAIPHPDGDSDQLWLIVRRTVNGATKRYVEILERTWESGTAIEDAFYIDSGLTYDGAPATTITGLWHMVGESLYGIADGVPVGPLVVSTTGTVTLAAAASVVQLGLPYEAEVETMRLEAGSADGTAQGKTKRITNVVLRVEDTGQGLQYGPKYDTVERVEDQRLTAGALLTGDTKPMKWPNGYEQAGRMNVRHSLPLPCTLIAMFPNVVTED